MLKKNGCFQNENDCIYLINKEAGELISRAIIKKVREIASKANG